MVSFFPLRLVLLFALRLVDVSQIKSDLFACLVACLEYHNICDFIPVLTRLGQGASVFDFSTAR